MPKKKNKYCLLLGLITMSLMLFYPVTGNSQATDTILAKFSRYRESNLEEKLFVHTNKDFYLAGEIIWFKIYEINGASNSLFSFSKVAYVELLNQANQSVYQTKVSLAGEGEGSIKIPVSLPVGNYVFRAYTAWMKNFSPDYFYKKTITIINAAQPGGGIVPKREKKYDIQFLPEGGNLVNGLQSEVGFRATDQFGIGIDFQGLLLNENNDTILRFKPFKFGIGHFSFTPRQEENYHAVLMLPDGSLINQALPAAYQEGYVLHLKKEGEKVNITVNANKAGKKVYLVIHTRGDVKATKEMVFDQGRAITEINLAQLGDGISQFTIFDETLRPVCERLFFKRLTRKLDIDIQSDKPAYGKRQKVTLSFVSNDEDNKPAETTMSVSVYRLDSLQGVDADNIMNYLWLTSELRGHIEHPEYYFSDSEETGQAMENLMLTQGWRRFSWDDVMKDKLPKPVYAPETGYPIITGQVKNRSGRPAAGVLAYLGILGKYDHVSGAVSNDGGFVYFRPEDVYERREIVVTTNTQSRDSVYHVDIISPFTDKASLDYMPAARFSGANLHLLQQHYLWQQIQEAYHGKWLDSLQQVSADSSAFYGKPYKIYHLDDYTRYTTMEEVMREYIMEVAVRKQAGHYHFQTMNALFNYDKAASATLFQDDPLMILDGIPVFNVDSLMALDPLKIEKLQVVAGRYFRGPLVADGIVSFSTYKKDMAGFKLNPQSLAMDYDGLQRNREFYSPIYDPDHTLSARIPDFRNALYWNAGLNSDSKGKAACGFYTSDIGGRYVVVVNGISADGRAGYRAIRFQVME